MRLKTLFLTIAVLAVLSIIVAIARRAAPPASADTRINQPLVDRATIEKATRLRISDAGKTVELERRPDGTWRVPSYHDMPADFTKLSGFVGNLTEAKLQRLVTSTPERIARLEFKDTKVELLDDAGNVLWSAFLGKTAESGGRYVRFGSEDKAYLANLQAWLDTDAKNWAEARLLTLKPGDIARVELSFPEGEIVTLSRATADDPWTAAPTLENQSLNTDKVTSLLNTLSGLRFSETTDLTDASATAAKASQRTVSLTTFDGKTVRIALRRKPEEKKLKPPAATPDEKSGPAVLGSITDLASGAPTPKPGEGPDGPKPIAPEYETIPAGPVFATITHSEPDAPVNELMKKRAFEVSDYTFSSLPQATADLFQPAAAQP